MFEVSGEAPFFLHGNLGSLNPGQGLRASAALIGPAESLLTCRDLHVRLTSNASQCLAAVQGLSSVHIPAT